MQSAATVLGVLRNHRRAGYPETGPSGSEGGRAEKDQFTLAPRRPADPTQTLKEYLARQDPPATRKQLQAQLDRFAAYYDQVRPYRALDPATPPRSESLSGSNTSRLEKAARICPAARAWSPGSSAIC